MKPQIGKKEHSFIQEKILTQGISTPILSVKDHKIRNEEGDFPTTIIVPAINFTAGFAKLGYLGIKKIFLEETQNAFQKQQYNMKEKFAQLHPKINKTMVATFDIKNMFPLIPFQVVKTAVSYYAKDTKKDKKIAKCQEMIKFRMGNQLFGFINKYYEYG